MLAPGTPLWVVSEVLGHASVPIIKDIYGHLIGGEKQEATEAITDVLFDNSQSADGLHVIREHDTTRASGDGVGTYRTMR